MKIINSHKIISSHVSSFKEIKEDALAMLELVTWGEFQGRHKEAFAISHCQVSTEPKAFFVLHDSANFNGDRIIINPVIVEASEPTAFKEGCMSFPFRGLINTSRYFKVTLEYQTKSLLGGLKRKSIKLEGIQAFIAQHETDHFAGMNIYQKFKK